MIAQFSSVHLAVITHTRGQEWKALMVAYPDLKDLANVSFIDTGVASTAVVRWSEVVLDIGTSMTSEAIMRGKLVICPEYLHATRSIAAEYFHEAIVNCRDELYDLIQKIACKAKVEINQQVDREKYRCVLVNGGNDNVADAYVNFLERQFLRKERNRVQPDNQHIDPQDSGSWQSILVKHLRVYQQLKGQERQGVRRTNQLLQTSTKIEEILTSPLVYQRERQKYFYQQGDLKQARDISLFIINTMSPSSCDYLALYHVGLRFHQQCDVASGTAIYQLLIDNRDVDDEIKAWAWFKLGEELLKGKQSQKADEYFVKALQLKPDHAKAKIYLTPSNQPLHISFEPNGIADDFIQIEMDLSENENWEYYFSKRTPSTILIGPSSLKQSGNIKSAMTLIDQYLGMAGHVLLQQVSTFSTSELTVIKTALRQVGFEAQENGQQDCWSLRRV